MKLAIVKPDHLGDLILSFPALLSLMDQNEVTLFTSSSTLFLAKYLFPNIDIQTIDFAHLQKNNLNNRLELSIFKKFDQIVLLRDDDVIRKYFDQIKHQVKILNLNSSHLLHETWNQKIFIEKYFAKFNRSKNYFSCFKENSWPTSFQSIGISPSAGYYGNHLEPIKWVHLCKKLLKNGIQVKLLGGPQEAELIKFISGQLKLEQRHQFIGSQKLDSLFEYLEEIDLVVASDSGLAHLISLKKPVLSIFGPSPFRQYSPFGKFNKVLSFDYLCSPCLQFSKSAINLCLSRECLSTINVEDIYSAIFFNRVIDKNLKLFQGVSHQNVELN